MNSIILVMCLCLITLILLNSKPIIECFQSTRIKAPRTKVDDYSYQYTKVNAPGTNVQTG